MLFGMNDMKLKFKRKKIVLIYIMMINGKRIIMIKNTKNKGQIPDAPLVLEDTSGIGIPP